MIAILLALLFLVGAPQQSGKLPDLTSQQGLAEGNARYEAYRQAAIHINELAGTIHSEADARAFVDAVAEHLAGEQPLWWATASIRHRVARAEYDAVSDPSKLVPEQRIVNVWNEYVRELDAPEETLVTVAEVHNLRDASYTSSQYMWNKTGFPQSLWTMPNIYAVGGDGKVAGGCRAVETLRVLYDLSRFFQNLQTARERVRKGVLASDGVRQQKNATPRPPIEKSQLAIASADTMPVRAAEYRYLRAHGGGDYQRLLERLYGELFPAE
jgi:hypothetical protein